MSRKGSHAMHKHDKKQQRGEEKRAMIINESLKLFKEKGYYDVTVDEIVKACNTSKGSFYHHFSSKTDILNEQFTLVDLYYDELYRSMPSTYTPKEQLTHFLQSMFTYLEETFGQHFLSIIYATSLEQDTHTYFRNPSRRLFELFEEMLQRMLKHYNCPLPLQELKQSLIQMTMGIIYYWCTMRHTMSLASSAEAPIALFLMSFSEKERLGDL